MGRHELPVRGVGSTKGKTPVGEKPKKIWNPIGNWRDAGGKEEKTDTVQKKTRLPTGPGHVKGAIPVRKGKNPSRIFNLRRVKPTKLMAAIYHAFPKQP